jgi:VRR-NUC domain
VDLNPKPDEQSFEVCVAEVARLAGWRCVHFRAARTKHGWRVPTAYDGQGWPDLTLVRPPRLVFVELKSQTGKLSDSQRDWLDVLRLLPNAEVHVWRPADWDALVETLTGTAPRKVA